MEEKIIYPELNNEIKKQTQIANDKYRHAQLIKLGFLQDLKLGLEQLDPFDDGEFDCFFSTLQKETEIVANVNNECKLADKRLRELKALAKMAENKK